MDCDWEAWCGVVTSAAWSRVGRCIHFAPLLHMCFCAPRVMGRSAVLTFTSASCVHSLERPVSARNVASQLQC